MGEKHIVLVEDDSTLSDSLAEHLEAAGFLVTVSKTAEEGWAKIENEKPDIVVTDVTLPGMDGLALAEKIAKTDATKNIPIIVLTNNDDGGHLAEAIGAGITTYILKADHSLSSIVETVKSKIL